ncbi:LysR family transcriptional regulator [Shinella sp. M27]|uniref:LysR family transcriptional regulator n=1 Tax=Shinella sp. M27 TaxID=3368614 RepID=UPI003BA344BA
MKRAELPSLDDLRAFEVVARLGSVRAAAEELNLTHGAVSRRVAKLSLDTGIRLIEPSGRGIRVTVAGAELAAAATGALSMVSSALVRLRATRAEAPVVVSSERSVAMRWLIPRLAAFQGQYPEVDLHLSVGGGAFDFTRDHITLAIRRLDFSIDANWRVEGLFEEAVGPVMHPDMAERFAAGHYVALAARTRPDAWQKWLSAHPDRDRPESTRFLDHHFLMVEAALAGLGVCMCPRILAIDDVSKGRLVAPLGFTPDGSRYGLISPAAAQESPSASLFRSWLAETIAADLSGEGMPLAGSCG